jgi:hypothetical protein
MVRNGLQLFTQLLTLMVLVLKVQHATQQQQLSTHQLVEYVAQQRSQLSQLLQRQQAHTSHALPISSVAEWLESL